MSFDEFHQRTTPQDSNLFVKSGDGQDAANALAKDAAQRLSVMSKKSP